MYESESPNYGTGETLMTNELERRILPFCNNIVANVFVEIKFDFCPTKRVEMVPFYQMVVDIEEDMC